ncbi:MAG TPA: magnesium/cobalt transporter CorA [Rhizobiales bacterium]|nr:magnesium/cobalt transporter CorA [Hyphomicrobiales bacterium]
MTDDQPRQRSVRKAKHSPVGASPGTLVADPNAVPPRLNLTLIAPERWEFVVNATLDDVRTCRRDNWSIVWVDCAGLADVGLIAEIGRIFGLHPLGLEDAVNTSQRPKVDFFDDHAFAVLRMIDDTAAHRYEQISLFFGGDFVVTFQEREGDPFDPIRRRIETSATSRLRTRKADYLAYALMDAIVDSYFHPVEKAGEAIDRIEDSLFVATDRRQARELQELRRRATALKQALWPLRDAFAGLVRTDAPIVRQETRVYLNDTLDHVVRLIEMVETQRDTLTGLIDMHLSLLQARTNEVVSFLTIISVIFIPLTFLAGIWGMNFDPEASPWNMPELLSYYGYPAALAAMVAVAVGMIAFFRWKRWL